MSNIETQKEQIRRFFEGVITEGITRELRFIDEPEEGQIEVELLAPPRH
jgi:hypothetical protein